MSLELFVEHLTGEAGSANIRARIGDLSPIRREKVQPSGGLLDMLLDDDDTR